MFDESKESDVYVIDLLAIVEAVCKMPAAIIWIILEPFSHAASQHNVAIRGAKTVFFWAMPVRPHSLIPVGS